MNQNEPPQEYPLKRESVNQKEVFSFYQNEDDPFQQQEKEPKLMLDIFNFKIFALLICRGSVSQKAEELWELINKDSGMKPIDKYRGKIVWSNPRLKKSIRMIIYFSEVLPKKFLNIHRGNKNLRMKIETVSNIGHMDVEADDLKSIQSNTDAISLTWREPYIVHMDENFQDITDSIYETKFIDRIFSDGNALTKEQWNQAIVGSLMGNLFGGAIDMLDGEDSCREKEMLKEMEEGALDWLFSPKKIRLAFKSRDQEMEN